MPTSDTLTGEDAPPNRRGRRSRTGATALTVVAVHLRSRSRRGLDWDLYSARCPACTERRIFTRSGLRRCVCGAALNVAVGAEVA
jgi:hypothetical protein